MTRPFAALVLVFAAAAVLPAQPNRVDDPKRKAADAPVIPLLIRKALKAQNSLRFSGERVVEVTRGLDVARHVEYVLKAGDQIRIWFPEESQFAGQVIVESGKERRHYFPGRNEIEVSKREEVFGRFPAFANQRRIGVNEGRGPVIAGRETELATVTANDGKVQQRLWIDPTNGMVLRRELYGPLGRLTASFEFQKVDFNPAVKPADFTIDAPDAAIVTIEDRAREMARGLGMAFVELPASAGFRLANANVRRARKLGVLHLAYTGPHGALSLFQVNGRLNLNQFMDKAPAGFQFYSWVMNGNSFALMGAYPLGDLQKLAHQIGGP